MANPFDNIFRTLNFHAPDLTLAAAAPLRNPFISNIAATTAIVTDAGAHVARIQFYALDANGNPETNAVIITASSAGQTVAAAAHAAATCVVVTTEIGLASHAATVKVLPGTGGLVDVDVTFGAAAADAKFAITNRFVTAAKAVAIA